MFKYIKDIYEEVIYYVEDFYKECGRFCRFLFQIPSLLKVGYKNSHNSDWTAIMGFVEYKTKQVRNKIDKRKLYEHTQTTVKQMDEFLNLMRETLQDAGQKELVGDWKVYEETYGEHILDFQDNKIVEYHTKQLTDEQIEQARVVRTEIYTKEEELREQKYNQAMDLFRKHLDDWYG